MPMRSREPLPARSDFRHAIDIATRWIDNDLYGHMNNAVYYAFFDTVINRYLIEAGGLDIFEGPVIGLAVETRCAFVRSIRFPDVVNACLRVAHLGTSSVRYEIALFVHGEDDVAAHGHFVHVFVDRATRRPTPIPERMREALQRIVT
jgi:acyl-CoA thioester hydrolase